MKNNEMTRVLLSMIGLFAFEPVTHAQFYYKDLVSNRQLVEEMAQLKEQKIRTVKVTSFEDDGSPSEGFFCEKKISRNYKTVEMFTRSNSTAASLFTSTFSSKGLLEETIDSSDISTTTTRYSYDENGRIKSIYSVLRSSDDDFTSQITEEHLYEYKTNGLPEKMIRVKNGSDSTTVLFSADEKNNVAIEKNTKSGDTYYYYYDAKNRLTDVVRLNPYNQKMLPDYMFEYNGAGQISQMTTTEEGGSYYFIWKYTYSNGLRVKEKCFSKERRLMGSIDYEYE